MDCIDPDEPSQESTPIQDARWNTLLHIGDQAWWTGDATPRPCVIAERDTELVQIGGQSWTGYLYRVHVIYHLDRASHPETSQTSGNADTAQLVLPGQASPPFLPDQPFWVRAEDLLPLASHTVTADAQVQLNAISVILRGTASPHERGPEPEPGAEPPF